MDGGIISGVSFCGNSFPDFYYQKIELQWDVKKTWSNYNWLPQNIIHYKNTISNN